MPQSKLPYDVVGVTDQHALVGEGLLGEGLLGEVLFPALAADAADSPVRRPRTNMAAPEYTVTVTGSQQQSCER